MENNAFDLTNPGTLIDEEFNKGQLFNFLEN
jgi:hypothetical protein